MTPGLFWVPLEPMNEDDAIDSQYLQTNLNL
jgi:hypothetical protein